MDNLGVLINNYVEQVQSLSEKLYLITTKKKYFDEINLLNEKQLNSQKICDNAKYIIENRHKIKNTYSRLMEKTSIQQLIMLKIIDKIEIKNKHVFPVPFQNLPTSSIKINNLCITPKMCLKQYMQSPLIKRVKAISLSFTDFEATINENDFAKVPSYLRGRDTCDDLNNFLTSIIIKCFTEKYTLSCKNREAVIRQADLKLWLLYQQQKQTFPNKKFITDGDISRIIGGLINKKMYSRISMLKHLRILKEIKESSTNYYIWLYNNEN